MRYSGNAVAGTGIARRFGSHECFSERKYAAKIIIGVKLQDDAVRII
ncbi:MAG: hypothetical protein HGA70_04720 [Chlorobiaceae bacterium]|nr:hypothetical protein [Chlorobiaceae bacterium]